MSDYVTVHEVGPRDGLQNEPHPVPVADRLDLIARLVKAGCSRVEIGSFVSPRWVPQMAGSDAVLAAVPAVAGTGYSVLVPNMRGWQDVAAAGFRDDLTIAVFIAASEGFSQANLNCSIADSLERIAPVIAAAQEARLGLRGYVSCVTDCPYDGPVAPQAVARAVHDLRALAPMPVSLGETIGKGTPDRVDAMLDAVLHEAPADAFAGHFHDTDGRALDNVAVSLDRGLRHFDAAAGGLGGCPYAPGAPGNLATEALVPFLHARGYTTGIDEAALRQVAAFAKGLRG